MSKEIMSRAKVLDEVLPLRNSIAKVYGALNSLNLPFENAETIQEELEKINLSLQFASMFSSDAVCTIAGPQGVGKSTLTNIMLEIPENAELVTGRGSCEHIPVIIKNSEVKLDKPVIIYLIENEVIKKDFLSYEDARKRVVENQKGDLFVEWFVKDSEKLKQLSPVIVLPGIQEAASFNRHIEVAIANSDVVIIATSASRAAQTGITLIKEWTKTYNVPESKTAMVATFVDTMSKEEEEDFFNDLKKYEYQTFKVSNENKSEKYGGHEDVFIWAVENMTKTDIEISNPGIKKIMSAIRCVVRNIDKEIPNITLDHSYPHKETIEKLKNEYERNFDMITRKIINNFNGTISAKSEKIVKSLDDDIDESLTKGWENKIDLFFAQNTPDGRKVRKIAQHIKDEFRSNDFQIELYNKSLKILVNHCGLSDDDSNVDSFLQTLISNALVTPLPQMDNTKQSSENNSDIEDKIQNIASGLDTAKNIMDKFTYKDGGKGSKDIERTVPLGEALFSLTKKGAGIGGAGMAGAEMAGAGFTGATATVLAGTIGTSIALIVAHSMISSYRRGHIELQNSLHSYFQGYVESLSEGLTVQVTRKLDEVKERIWYLAEKELENKFGITSKNIDIIHLLEYHSNLKKEYKKIASNVKV